MRRPTRRRLRVGIEVLRDLTAARGGWITDDTAGTGGGLTGACGSQGCDTFTAPVPTAFGCHTRDPLRCTTWPPP